MFGYSPFESQYNLCPNRLVTFSLKFAITHEQIKPGWISGVSLYRDMDIEGSELRLGLIGVIQIPFMFFEVVVLGARTTTGRFWSWRGRVWYNYPTPGKAVLSDHDINS